jgi:gamma-butyrobetaine dioxygenase
MFTRRLAARSFKEISRGYSTTNTGPRRPFRPTIVRPANLLNPSPQFEATKSFGLRDDLVTVSSGDRFIQLHDKNTGGWTRLDAILLRDSCTCTACVDTASGQKSFATTAIPSDITIEDIRPTEEGVGIKFKNDMYQDHEMILPFKTIDRALSSDKIKTIDRALSADKINTNSSVPRRTAVYKKTGRTFWNKATIEQRVRKIDYHEFMKGSDAFWHTLLDLSNLGLVFLENVPHDENSIVNITTRIANIKETFYGRTFDVRAKPDAENVAYTSGYLGLHQDLLYLESPPAIQLLHCMENSCSGGESLFSDGLYAGNLLDQQSGSAWQFVKSLTKIRVPYHYEKHGYLYRHARPILDSELRKVFWSPPFQDQFRIPAPDVRTWLEAAKLFDTLINDPDAMYEIKMKPGECVLFDNLRIMHGRNQFDVGGGSRWLRGAYISGEDIDSRTLHIPEELATEYRAGKEWTRKTEKEEVQASERFHKVRQQIDDITERLEKMKVRNLGNRNRELLNKRDEPEDWKI